MGLKVAFDAAAQYGIGVVAEVSLPDEVLDFEPTECVPVRPLYLKGHELKDPCALSRSLFDTRNVEAVRLSVR